MMPAPLKLKKENLLLISILVMLAAFFLFLVLGHRMMRGHDGFSYFTSQYLVLNNAVMHGEIPQWEPYILQGTLMTWWYYFQAGIFQTVLLGFAGLLKAVNFLPLFHLGMIFDEILLLTGVWLLARRFFSSPYTWFFVAITVIGSCHEFEAPFMNFHFYYALPLIFHFFHRFLDTAKWRYFLLGGNLLAVQMLGSLPYLIAMTSLVVFLYFFAYFIFNFKVTWQQLKNINWSWKCLPYFGFVALSFGLAYYMAIPGTSEIANYHAGRQADLVVQLHQIVSVFYGRHRF